MTGLSENSKTTNPGELFICIPGAKVDGRVYADEAIQLGARALMIQGHPLRGMEVPQLVVKDSRESLARPAFSFLCLLVPCNCCCPPSITTTLPSK